MNAQDILNLSTADADKLFPGTKAALKKRFRELAQIWHPDHCSDKNAGEVFSHILHLYQVRKNGSKISKKPSVSKSSRTWIMKDGAKIAVTTKAIRKGAFGDVIVSNNSVSYEATAGFEDISDKEALRVSNLQFASDGMRINMAPTLPSLHKRLDAVGVKVNVFKREPETVLLIDLIQHMGGKMPALHAAWLISCMENIACYLHWAGITHGAISAENILVNPKQHSIVLVGGWGVATEFGKRPTVLPNRTVSLVPRLAVSGELATPSIDLALIRATAKEILGASSTGSLAVMKDIPDAMKTWLSMPPASNAMEDYKNWEKCLETSFGPRKFIPLNVKPSEVYASN